MIEIRQATVEDSALIIRFITELAAYEKAENEVIATESDIKNSLFASDSSTSAVICNLNNKPVGFAVYFFNYSTMEQLQKSRNKNTYTRNCRIIKFSRTRNDWQVFGRNETL